MLFGVGAVQFFIKHTISVKNSPQEDPYSYIHWKKSHPHEIRYGISATLCTDVIEDLLFHAGSAYRL